MGCGQSKEEASQPSAMEPLDSKMPFEDGSSGRPSMLQNIAGLEVEGLIQRLEKLDEERLQIQQQLNRAHNIVELADGAITEETLEAPSVRLFPCTDLGCGQTAAGWG